MEWKKQGLIFEPDVSLAWSQSHAQVPTVLQLEPGKLRLYYGARDTHNRMRISFFDVNAAYPAEILYQHKTPVLELGDIGHFDDSGVMPSDVVRVGEKVFLYYVGWNVGVTSRYRTAIGLAISEDGGETFKKVAPGPIMDRTMEDPVSISCQSVRYEDGLFRTWYMSYTRWKERDGQAEPFYEIKYADSEDGIHWRRTDQTCIPLRDNEGGVACPTVLYDASGYKMWYSTRGSGDYRGDASESYRIGYATSTDGIAWDRKDHRCKLDTSEAGWDSEMVAYPSVIQLGDRVLMFYNGNGFGRSGIGYAEANSTPGPLSGTSYSTS